MAVTPRFARPELAKASRHLAVAVNLVPRAVARTRLRTRVNQDIVRPREYKEYAASEKKLHGVSNFFQRIDYNSIFTSTPYK